MTITINPCPFCGYHDVEICEVEPGRIAIDCPDCECIGPFADTAEGAAALWNEPYLKRRQTEIRASILCEQCLSLERRIEKLQRLAADLRDPERFGHAVSAEVRKAAQEACQ